MLDPMTATAELVGRLRVYERAAKEHGQPASNLCAEAATTIETLAAAVAVADRDKSEAEARQEGLFRKLFDGNSYKPVKLSKYTARHWTVLRRLVEEHAGTEVADAIAMLAWWSDIDAERERFLISDWLERNQEAEVRATAAEAERDRLRVHLSNIFAKLDKRDGAPGHLHTVRGVWDQGNPPEKAGKPCDWCAQWEAAREDLSPQALSRDGGGDG